MDKNNLKNKDILILGFGITGISAAKTMLDLGANIYIIDDNIDKILDENPEYNNLKINIIKDIKEISRKDFLFCIKSPGIHPENSYIKEIEKNNIEILSDLELAYRLYKNRKIIAITGTNGKTTTTSLVGQIIKESKRKSHIVGNIGIGMLSEFNKGGDDDIYIIESSSFQLHDISSFKPNIGCIINITPDHIDWHGSMENYILDKLKIFKNSENKDISIINYDDEILKTKINSIKGRIILFSKNTELEKGVFIKNNNIIVKEDDEKIILKLSDIQLPGAHNIENVIAAVAISYYLGIDKDTIQKAVKNFKGVEHRIEFVREVQGIKFYNDSKGTNVDASINAINAFDKDIILIAGGYDKGVDFDKLIDSFDDKIKALVLLGETKDKIKNAAAKSNVKDIFLVDDLKEAVDKSFSISIKGDIILLSPACASWDMYKNFEERGKDFKQLVKKIG